MQSATSFVEISPELAEDRGIHEGAEVKLISETGEAGITSSRDRSC